MKKILLSRGKTAIVDDEDFDVLSQFKWFAFPRNRTWYAVRNTSKAEPGKRHQVFMHRQILGAVRGQQVDHQDGNGLNNRRENIRVATPLQNQRNQVHKRRGCSSKYKGVCWCKRSQKWVATISTGKLKGGPKRKTLGYFDSEKKAAWAYDDAAREIFGEFASLNFPRRLG